MAAGGNYTRSAGKKFPQYGRSGDTNPRQQRVTYREGSVRAEGFGALGRAVTGEGYVELTGYAGPVEF